MEITQGKKLDPRIKRVWRLSDTILLTIIFAAIIAIPAIILLFDNSAFTWFSVRLCIVIAIVYAVFLLLFWFVVTPLRYIRWNYQLSSEFLDITCGIIVRKHTVIPFIRVQNTDTKQGPILRMMGLSSVTISTAAGSMEIPGLPVIEAEALRDQAAEYARLAKEDV